MNKFRLKPAYIITFLGVDGAGDRPLRRPKEFS